MKTLIQISRNKINAKNKIISAVWPGATLNGFYVGGKAVPSRAMLTTPQGMKSELVISAAGLKKA